MQLLVADFNGSDALANGKYAREWGELESCLRALALPLKASDQRGKQGEWIFSPVATNASIATALKPLGWKVKHPIPAAYQFLGLDVDFCKPGVLAEVQFSNYPFLLNNLLRSEVFFRDRDGFLGSPLELLVIVTKAHRLPASNSTLYFEQAARQIADLIRLRIFQVPLRIVGLTENLDARVPAQLVTFRNPRYSRDIVGTDLRKVILRAPSATSRSKVEVVAPRA